MTETDQLESLALYKNFRQFYISDSNFSALDSSIREIVSFSHNRSKNIIKNLPHYTLHDSEHCFRVAEIMANIIGNYSINKLSIVDYFLLLSSAYLHDIGLAPTAREVSAWRVQITTSHVPKHSDRASIKNFLYSRPDDLFNLNRLREDSNHEKYYDLENAIISDFIRQTHGARSTEIIVKSFPENLKYSNTDLLPFLTAICRSHTEDAILLKQFENLVPLGNNNIFSPPFCAVILRLADLMDFDAKRAPKALFDSLQIENEISINEWKKHRSITAWQFGASSFSFRAECDHPIIQEGLYSYCDYIDDELQKCGAVIRSIQDSILSTPDHYKITLPDRINRDKIIPRNTPHGKPIYTYSKTRFTLDKEKIVDLLMGTSLYGNPEVALRELLQNSFDACLVRSAFENVWKRTYIPEVNISLKHNEGKDYLVVSDNGIGMDSSIIQNFYSKVGACYYKSNEFYLLCAEKGVKFTSISKFGIGVLSYFLVSNSVEIYTRRTKDEAEAGDPIAVRVDGVNGLFWISATEPAGFGTRTTLQLLDQHPWRETDAIGMRNAIRNIIPEPPFPIKIQVDGIEYSHRSHTHTSVSKDNTQFNFPKSQSKIVNNAVRFHHISGGYKFVGKIYWLESSGNPVLRFDTVVKDVRIDGSNSEFQIHNYIEASENKITQWSTSFDYNDGNIIPIKSYRHLLSSKVDFSLHGFSVPFRPFKIADDSDPMDFRLKCTMDLPFCVQGALIVSSPSDLTLNAARDGVIPDQQWYELRSWFLKGALSELANAHPKKYISSLFREWLSITKQEWVKNILKTFD